MKYRNSDKYLTVKRIKDAGVYINIGEAVYVHQCINGYDSFIFYGIFQAIDESGNVYFCNGEKFLSQLGCYLLNVTHIE
jgi:hypothetical protein